MAVASQASQDGEALSSVSCPGTKGENETVPHAVDFELEALGGVFFRWTNGTN